jgi:hypothetical protein
MIYWNTRLLTSLVSDGKKSLLTRETSFDSRKSSYNTQDSQGLAFAGSCWYSAFNINYKCDLEKKYSYIITMNAKNTGNDWTVPPK